MSEYTIEPYWKIILQQYDAMESKEAKARFITGLRTDDRRLLAYGLGKRSLDAVLGREEDE